MISLQDYTGREQTYVKHVFLSLYFERLVHITASRFDHIAYVDGFAGPWQSANERYEDTSFGIALTALRRAKASWRALGRGVSMSAHLVERDETAYARLEEIKSRFPDITIYTYPEDFVTVASEIVNAIRHDAFAFVFIDPKGWRIDVKAISAMLRRPKSEVVFNFMFDFINWAASMRDPAITRGLDELIPYGDWRAELERVQRVSGRQPTPEQRKSILVSGFTETLSKIGDYPFVAETTVFRPFVDRPLYCLFYATRHSKGVEVFRDCQIKTLNEQSSTRAAIRLQRNPDGGGQGELFESLHEMGPDETSRFLLSEQDAAAHTLMTLAPDPPEFKNYGEVRTIVLTRHVVKTTDVNRIAARLRKEGRLSFPEWKERKQVPDENYRVQRLVNP